LNALEVLPEKIVDIDYLPSEQIGIVKENHRAIYDLYVKMTNGRRYIIEMQVSPHYNFIERLLLYSSYSIVYQSKKGKSVIKNDDEKEIEVEYDIAGIYVIAILDFVLFEEEEAKEVIMEQVKLMRQKVSKEFTDKLQFLIIELPKFKKTLDASTTVRDKILYSLKHMNKLKERPEEMNEDILKQLYEAAKINKLSEKEMETYKASVMEYRDVRQVVYYARNEARKEALEEGIEIGIEKGRKEEQIKFAKILYAMNTDIDTIIRHTGFTGEQIHDIVSNS
jgi:predicted transposase/invertase (TIGR01784 family)